MKKFLAFALAAMAVSVHAAPLDWGLGGEVYLIKPGQDYSQAVIATDSNAPQVANGAYLALVYIGQNADSFDIADITAASVVDTMPYGIDTSFGGADYDPFQQTFQVTATDGYSNGASFGVVWFDGNAFDYVYSVDDGSAINSASVGGVVTVEDVERGTPDPVLPASWTQGYGGVLVGAPVPEPSVALMGLLGLGMMLKRRRA